MPSWLTAPVLRLAIPDSPFAAGYVPASMPEPAPQPEPPAVEVALSIAMIDVPLLVEPVAPSEPKSEPALPRDVEAEIADAIAAVLAAAPEAIEPVTVDLAAAPTEAAPAPAPPPPAEEPEAAQPQPEPPIATASPARADPQTPKRVTIRRAQPKIRRLPQKAATPPPSAAPAGAGLSERLDRVGTQAPRPRAAATPHPAPASQPRPAEPPSPPGARAPARDRPVMAPAAANVARLPRTVLAPAAVPETRPLTQNRRLYRRVMLAAELEIDGTACRLIDLSIGGFAAFGAPKLNSGAVVPVTLRMSIDGINIGTQFAARIIYGNGARAAGRFVELTAAQTAFLRYIVTWRGEAIGAVGTTTLLDAITRWPERAFQPHPSTVPPPRPGLWSRLIGRIPLLGWRRRP